MTWLWSIFAGFYLVAYVFWVPTIFSNILVVLLVVAVTSLLGFGLLYDGFGTALGFDGTAPVRPLPSKRVFRFLGGFVLLAYVLIYLPPGGRIVAHWPLDLAITLVSGVITIVYGVIDR
jgi:hypothetical protein